jgi:hypothetical protein
MSALENTLYFQIEALGIPLPACEYRFAAEHVGIQAGIRARLKAAGLKDWRFDFAWPDKMLAVEVEGGAWVNGRHTRGAGFTADIEKYHHAMSLGWTVYRCDGALVKRGQAVGLIERLIGAMDERNKSNNGYPTGTI